MEAERQARADWQRRQREEHLRQHNLFRQRFMNGTNSNTQNTTADQKIITEDKNNTSQVGSLLESDSEGVSKLESYNTSEASSVGHDKSFKIMTESENESENENNPDWNQFEELD